MGALYNEHDPYAAAWLGNLITAGHVAPGHVDSRSIKDLQAHEIPSQAHFFAGIGVWSYALRLAGVPDTAPVWTGSCPCQPFSKAGRGEGTADPRHWWPTWFSLIRQCSPVLVFGEQVDGPAGRQWLDPVRTDLEDAGYAFGAAVLPAAGFGAPHARSRVFWCACRLAHPLGFRRGQAGCQTAHHPAQDEAGPGNRAGHAGPDGGAWAAGQWLPFIDGKHRQAEPGTFPLADGPATRVGRLRAYGNAIVPQVAAAFITAALDVLED